MKERFSNPEHREHEDITEAEVIEVLRAKGLEDSEAKSLLIRWTEQEEGRVPRDPESSIDFNRRQARLYLAAGYRDDAIDTLTAAMQKAWNEYRDALYQEIREERDAIRAGEGE